MTILIKPDTNMVFTIDGTVPADISQISISLKAKTPKGPTRYSEVCMIEKQYFSVNFIVEFSTPGMRSYILKFSVI